MHDVGIAMSPAAELRAAAIVGDASSDTIVANNCSAAMASVQQRTVRGTFLGFHCSCAQPWRTRDAICHQPEAVALQIAPRNMVERRVPDHGKIGKQI